MTKHHCNKCNIDYWEDDENEPRCPMCEMKMVMQTLYIRFAAAESDARDMCALIEETVPDIEEIQSGG